MKKKYRITKDLPVIIGNGGGMYVQSGVKFEFEEIAEVKETLEEKFISNTNGNHITEIRKRAKYLAEIAKSHYQQHPEELFTGIEGMRK